MTQDVKHSPLPWALNLPEPFFLNALGSSNGYWISGMDGNCQMPICQFYNVQKDYASWTEVVTPQINAEANAKFIVTACNSHYENLKTIANLTRALANARSAMDYCLNEIPQTDPFYKKVEVTRNVAHALLAKVK